MTRGWSDISVVIPTFGEGSDEWVEMLWRAQRSAARQKRNADKVIQSHAENLAKARNLGAVQSPSDWIVFLDADDTLDVNYLAAMYAARRAAPRKNGNYIFRPATLGVVDGVEDDAPVMIPRRDLFDANCIVIGAMVRKDQFLKVGGFTDLPIFEDWDLFLRLFIDGAEIIDVPEAVYRVTVRPDSRNHQAPAIVGKVYSQIRNTYAPYRAIHSD